MRATYTRMQGVRHLFAAPEWVTNKRYGHIKKLKSSILGVLPLSCAVASR
jgi:hypothetical protein